MPTRSYPRSHQQLLFFDIIRLVKRKKKVKEKERPVFDSIRKPTAPPSRRFGGDAPEEKVRPSLRKVKHKKSLDTEA